MADVGAGRRVQDSDVGGGVAIVGGRAYVAGKSGYFYTLDRGDGRVLERHDLNPFARNGGSIGTPPGDGTVLLIGSGPKRNPDSAGDSAGSVMTAGDMAYALPVVVPSGVCAVTNSGDVFAFGSRGGEEPP